MASHVKCMISKFDNRKDDNCDVMQLKRTDSEDSNESTSPLPSSPPGETTNIKIGPPSSVVMITQPSPLEAGVNSDRNVTTTATTTSKEDVATPARRSRRVRTPSAKKKASIETERLLQRSKSKESLSVLETPAGINPLDTSYSVERAVLDNTSASIKDKKSRLLSTKRRKATQSATKTPSSVGTEGTFETVERAYLRGNPESECKKSVASATNAAAKSDIFRSYSVSSNPPLQISKSLSMSLSPIDKTTPAGSPATSGGLLNADILNTPTQSATLEGNEDDLTWLSAATPTTYFGDSPLIDSTPPPKRQSRVRTPFAKAFISMDVSDENEKPNPVNDVPKPPVDPQPLQETKREDSKADDKPLFNDSALSANYTGREKSLSSLPPPSPANSTGANEKPLSNLAALSPAINTEKPLSNLPAPSPTSSTGNVDSTKATVDEGVRTLTPRKRKSQTEETPLRRSTRRASLMSATKIKLQSSSSKNVDDLRLALHRAKSADDAEKPIKSTLNEKATIGTPLQSTIELAPDSSNPTKKRRSTRRASVSVVGCVQESPSASSVNSNSSRRSTRMSPLPVSDPNSPSGSSVEPSQSLASSAKRKSRRSSLSIDTGRKDIVAGTESDHDEKGSAKKRSSRRASIATARPPRSESSASTQELSLSRSETFSDNEKPPKKPRSSRRASLSVATQPSSLEVIGLSSAPRKSLMPPLAPSRDQGKATGAEAKKTSTTSTFKLPPLPTSTLTSKRFGRRSSVAGLPNKSYGKQELPAGAATRATKEENVLEPSTNVERIDASVSSSNVAKTETTLSSVKSESIPPPPAQEVDTSEGAPALETTLTPATLADASNMKTEPTQSAFTTKPPEKVATCEVSEKESSSKEKPRNSDSTQKSSNKSEPEPKCVLSEGTPSRISLRRSPRRLATKPKTAPSPLLISKPPQLSVPTVAMDEKTAETPVKKLHVENKSLRHASPKRSDTDIQKQELKVEPLSRPPAGAAVVPKSRSALTISTTMANQTATVPRQKLTNISSATAPTANEKPSNRTTPLASRENCAETKSSFKGHAIAPFSRAIDSHPTIEKPMSAKAKIEAEAIKKYASRIFSNADILREACVSARLFALFALQNLSSLSNLEHATIPTVLRPLMPLLKALVHVEMTSLEEVNNDLQDSENRRVHFSGFDCSSVKPPVESVEGSASHQSDCIDTLILASLQINSLVKQSTENDAENASVSSSLVSALNGIIKFLGGLDSDSMQECAKSISTRYPSRRVAKAVDMYKKDFDSILQRVKSPENNAKALTSLELRLAELTGQCIRFHLRRLFNPPPLPLTTPPSDSDSEGPETKSPQKSLLQSCVYELIELKVPSASRDSAVADCSISSLISLALMRIYAFFGAECFQSDISESDPIALPETFCTSPGSTRGLGVPCKSPTVLPAEDLNDLLGDINHVYDFLGAYRACKFLVELMQAPGVESEIETLGGWSIVEHYAGVLLDQKLITVCPEDAHFATIAYSGTMEKFFAKIKHMLSHMEPKVALAEIGVTQISKRYKTRIASPKQKRAMFKKFPHVKTIADAIEEGQNRSTSFPMVSHISMSP